MYLIIKYCHIGFALLSIGGFILRGALSLRRHPVIKSRWLRIAPHINDTLLLAAAIYLAQASHQYPWNSPWLAAKVTALLIYIVLGTLVIRQRGSTELQLSCYLGALLAFAYMLAVAISKSAWPFT